MRGSVHQSFVDIFGNVEVLIDRTVEKRYFEDSRLRVVTNGIQIARVHTGPDHAQHPLMAAASRVYPENEGR